MPRLLRDVYENEYAVSRAHSEQCKRQYRLTLSRWTELLGHEPTLADLDDLIVQRYLAHRREQVKAATARKDRNQIAAVWGYCAKRRYVEQFPTLQQIRAPGRIPRGYTVSDVSALLREAMKPQPPIRAIGGLKPHLWFPPLIRCCWETVERIAPHLALQWQDVDLDARYVVFRAEGRKGATRDIMRPISADLAAWMQRIRREEGERVWPWTLDKSCLWHHFGKLCDRAKITNRGFHGLRKSAASYIAAAGGDATQLLDHSNPKITSDHYIDRTIARPRQTAIDLLPPLDLNDRPHDQPPEKPAA